MNFLGLFSRKEPEIKKSNSDEEANIKKEKSKKITINLIKNEANKFIKENPEKSYEDFIKKFHANDSGKVSGDGKIDERLYKNNDEHKKIWMEIKDIKCNKKKRKSKRSKRIRGKGRNKKREKWIYV